MREAVIFEAERTGYGIDQVANRAITVGDLIEILESYGEDTLFILSHDRGYTFGSLRKWDGILAEEEEDGEWYIYDGPGVTLED